MPLNLNKDESPVIRIDLGVWYKTGEVIHPLTELLGEKLLKQVYLQIVFAHNHLVDVSSSFKTSLANANILKNILCSHITSNPDFEKNLSSWDIYNISTAAKNFEIALKAELGITSAYLVITKGGYNVDTLTLRAQDIFNPNLLKLAPEAKKDMEESAKCLAFEVPTAAGFHLHRLNEAVLHRYWDAVSNGKPRPVNNKGGGCSIGEYITIMEREKVGEEKILSCLRQINNLHRNPVLHPQDNLTVQEAIELFGIIVSSTSAMLTAINTLQEIQDPNLNQVSESSPVLATQFS